MQIQHYGTLSIGPVAWFENGPVHWMTTASAVLQLWSVFSKVRWFPGFLKQESPWPCGCQWGDPVIIKICSFTAPSRVLRLFML